MQKISIVYSCNDAYVPFTYISIVSLIQHSSIANSYNIYILYSDISKENQRYLEELQRQNIRIFLINVSEYKKQYETDFTLSFHFSIETYYRFFLSQLFSNLDKIIYIDADTLVQKDVAELFTIDIGNNYLGVTRDCEIIRSSNLYGEKYSDYFTRILGLKYLKNYFQAGVMIVNLKRWREDKIQQKLLERLKEVKTPQFVDQDILNSVCQENVVFIKQNWNYTWHILFMDKQYYCHIGAPYNRKYENARKQPYIIHFTGQNFKPLNYPCLQESKLFWYYARRTPFYEELLFRSIQLNLASNMPFSELINLANYSKNRFNYYRCKLLSKITLGKLRKHYKEKRKKLKSKLKQVRKFLKGK